MTILADDLLSGIKMRALIATSEVTLSDTNILTLANQIMQVKIVPMIESTQSDFFVTTEEEDFVAGQTEYSIPYRAIGRTLRDLKVGQTGSDGNLIRATVYSVRLIKLEDENLFQYNGFNYVGWGFYFKGDKIHIVPDVPATLPQPLKLQKWFRIAPSKLVESSNAALVVSVSDPDVIVSSVPSNLSTNSVVDFIQGISGNSIIEQDATITNISGTTITFGAGVVPSSLQAGDWISLAQTAPLATMIPNECQSYIETLTVQRALKLLGDIEGAQALESDAKEEKSNLLLMLEPRIDGEPKIIINRNSILRSRVGGFNGFYYPYGI